MPEARAKANLIMGRWLVLAVAFLACIAAWAARAQDATSSHFLLFNSALTGYGDANATSASFGTVGAGEVLSGDSTSNSFYLRSGPLSYDGTAVRSQTWRFYDDYGNETPSVPLANENVAPSNVQMGSIMKLRLNVAETGGVSGTIKLKLQYGISSDLSDAQDVMEIGNCTGSSAWCYANASGTDNAVISAKVLSTSAACSGGIGDGCGTHNTGGISTSTFIQPKNATTEYEFSILQKSAAVNTVYYFRAFDVNSNLAVPLYSTSTYPSITTGGSILTFSVSGLPEGTTTEGISTNVSTTASGIAFGHLPFNTPVSAAQRLMITTNAQNGYQIFVMQDQALQNELATAMPGVLASNPSPAGWTTGCAADLSGCYGYHTGADLLSGDSVRFAPNDTYARLSTSGEEIAFSPSGVTSATVDMVFRTQVQRFQQAGNYQNRVSYIAVPIF